MFGVFGVFASARPADAAWRPTGVRPTAAVIADVLAAHDRSIAAAPAAYRMRREHWTYVNGSHRFPVTVSVRGDDVRADVSIDGAIYSAGRTGGVRWRADANGITHGVQADLQGDAADRLPEALFPFDPHDCELIGEAVGDAPSWVVRYASAGDRPQFFFIDKTSGEIVKSISRKGGVVITIAFDRFDAADGPLRPRHWIVSDGDGRHAIDATVDSVTPAQIAVEEVSFPSKLQRRTFTPVDTSMDRVPLAAEFLPTQHIQVEVAIDGRKGTFILDTGTASITLGEDAAGALPGGSILEHATVPTFDVGGLRMENVSVLTLPFGRGISGILGYDFFFGHIVHIDYANKKVEVLSHRLGDAVFGDPANTVVEANVDQGLPIARVALDGIDNDGFALDTGSQRVVVLQPFLRRFPDELSKHWSRRGIMVRDFDYLEGSINAVNYIVPSVVFGPVRFENFHVYSEVPDELPEALEIPFDGILGSDVLHNFELWFDFDNGRLAMRYEHG